MLSLKTCKAEYNKLKRECREKTRCCCGGGGVAELEEKHNRKTEWMAVNVFTLSICKQNGYKLYL